MMRSDRPRSVATSTAASSTRSAAGWRAWCMAPGRCGCSGATDARAWPDVAAHDAAHSDIRRALVGGLQAHGQLWRRTAEGDQAQANDQRAHVQAAGQAQSGAYQ
ncbi:hypothetical protein WR25_03493 [Diploscapter pachys]|uniref:Uncharacterized protein n=1 Tax=Diploscapter pachys TaxID=2018661 RepID=A0A2A2KDC7_9BILA|nr:hypothetical protein WR25_03493 [Diploscapter pachys]